jgi:hypothetical protein
MYILRSKLFCFLYELIEEADLHKFEVPLVTQNSKGAVYATGITDGRDLNLENHSAGITFLSRGADAPVYSMPQGVSAFSSFCISTLTPITWKVSIPAGPPMVKM